jgi:hypothetical protein
MPVAFQTLMAPVWTLPAAFWPMLPLDSLMSTQGVMVMRLRWGNVDVFVERTEGSYPHGV